MAVPPASILRDGDTPYIHALHDVDKSPTSQRTVGDLITAVQYIVEQDHTWIDGTCYSGQPLGNQDQKKKKKKKTSMAPPQLNLLRPLLLLAFSAAFIPITIFKLVTTFQFSKLASWAAFQHAWFGRFWAWFGPQSREYGGPAVEPILAKARGVVLDIGPGNGQWVNLFSAAKNKDIKKIYGVEPNPDHHAALRQRVKSAGLEGIYEVLPVGVEDLESCGIEKGSVDTIATIQCLCSVPGPEDIIKSLYPYLKPGGQWLVYEHVRTPHQHDFVATWQGTYMGCFCCLATHTGRTDSFSCN